MKFLLSILLTCILHYGVSQNIQLTYFNTPGIKITEITNAGDDRLYIAFQNGVIRISDLSGILNASTFIDLSNKVNSQTPEQGLLGMAFSPDYNDDRSFYLNYINNQGNSVVSRFKRNPIDPDKADSSSEQILLTISQPFPNHNGGSMHFGPDGYLYIATGDGGSGGDPFNVAQDSSSLLGKILRIDVRGTGNTYTTPPDNPFVGVNGYAPEIWSLGLRNPWRVSFDRLTGDLWVSDVGQQNYEEINFQPAGSHGGENYGWRCYEANTTFNTTSCSSQINYTFPIFDYAHSIGNGCSVTGGYVSRSVKQKKLFGKYFFSDYCSGNIWSIYDSSGVWITHEEGTFVPWTYSTFGQDAYGELYLAEHTSGKIMKIESKDSCDLLAYFSATDTLTTCGNAIRLQALYSPEIQYQWHYNGIGSMIGNDHLLLANKTGYYQVIVTNGTCADTSKAIYVDVHSTPTYLPQIDSVFCQQDYTVNWTIFNSVELVKVDGEVVEDFNPSVISEGPHSLEFYYSDSIGCLNYLKIDIDVIKCKQGFAIYPNPFNDNIHIVSFQPTTINFNVELFDGEGRLVKTTNVKLDQGQNQWIVKTHTLATGHYYIRIVTKDAVFEKKLLKF